MVDYDSASRRGEPFAMLIRAHKLLPNAHKRISAADLKVETAARFAQTRLGWWPAAAALDPGHSPRRAATVGQGPVGGVPDRVPPSSTRTSRSATSNGSGPNQPFDLEIHRDLGNCDLCFLKGRWKLMRLMTQHPERAEWWIEQERYRRSVARTVRKPELTRLLDALHLRGPEEHAHDAVRRTPRAAGSERGRVLLLRRLS